MNVFKNYNPQVYDECHTPREVVLLIGSMPLFQHNLFFMPYYKDCKSYEDYKKRIKKENFLNMLEDLVITNLGVW